MRVTFCGVRGSTCAPGIDFVRYGGHTSCVALGRDGGLPTLVLDAGTGLRNLTRHLDGQPFRGTILLGHLHWDHTHGIPFFAAGNQPGSEVTVVMPAQGDPEQVLERAFSPPHFPVTPTQLQGRWRVRSHEPGQYEVEGFSVLAAEIPHKGGRTFGYRVTDGGGTLAYLSDHSPVAAGAGPHGLGAYHESALALADDVDLLIHDAQHTAAEFTDRAFLGHSAVEYAVGLAEAAGARTLVLFHHDPARTDDEIDALVVAHAGGRVEVVAAAEGLTIDV
ncbi:MAG TPA: MBL fold metallo-hydrolase [Acidimicrobiales bacterium]|jgi:phosphoribosyl 1,2-cyclic phosphodiesterase|nr:MBL fold metallo-hydrolase [Acidimicrobiales bacterium]